MQDFSQCTSSLEQYMGEEELERPDLIKNGPSVGLPLALEHEAGEVLHAYVGGVSAENRGVGWTERTASSCLWKTLGLWDAL